MTTETLDKPAEKLQNESGFAPPQGKATAAFDPLAPLHHKRQKRTTGLWLVDFLVYPIINNIGVFTVSVFATYLTQHGWPKRLNGESVGGIRGWFGEFMQNRGKNLDNFLQDTFNFSKKNAEMGRMVFFSFFDGTFIAPLVKLFEDRREQMALGIDTALGTKPKDETAYEVEPKQTWGSVLEGRLLTSLVVVPTAVVLSKTLGKGTLDKIGYKPNHALMQKMYAEAGDAYKGTVSLNDIMFNAPGYKYGHKVEEQMPRLKAGIQKIFGKVELPYLFKTISFEAFYTSVCTAGLYVISRFIARRHPTKDQLEHLHHADVSKHGTAAPATADVSADQSVTSPAPKPPTPEKPGTQVGQKVHMERVANPAKEVEVTA